MGHLYQLFSILIHFRYHCYRQATLSVVLIGLLSAELNSICPASAQVTSDGTLSTLVKQIGSSIEIRKGNLIGSNLFHSFSEFSIPEGFTAIFKHNLNTKNIIGRVTGNSISHIQGILQSNGSASLILLNPNGIIFGPKAQLNIGGSFIGTTAESIQFADGVFFASHHTPFETPPLLTVSAPKGLQFGANPGVIINRSNASPDGALTPFGDPVGLQVTAGRTFALIGGNVILEGGHINAPGGRIELGSVGGGSFVTLTPENQDFSFGYDRVESFKDIFFREALPFNSGDLASINVSGAGGAIRIQGQRVTLTNGSQVFNVTTGAGDGGSLEIVALDTFEVTGFASGLFSQVGGTAPSGSTPPVVTGNGGAITITTKRLVVRDGGVISSATASLGNSGDLTINVSESVEISGIGEDVVPIVGKVFLPSQLTTSTDSSGAGGALTINTKRLVVRDGGQILSSTFGPSPSGTLTVNASESIAIKGSGLLNGVPFPSRLATSSGLAGLPTQPSGDAQALSIHTQALTVQEGAELSVTSLGQGTAGTLDITAESVLLDQSNLTAASAISNGGNVSLQVTDSLVLRNGSQISAEAGSAGIGTGTGGNIDIDAGVVAALPQENSDIFANAFGGPGGNISINTQGLFGLSLSDQLTPESGITASSETGLAGTVAINTPDEQISAEFLLLPNAIPDPSKQINASCAPEEGNQFVITGRGGVPLNPQEQLFTPQPWEDLRDLSIYRHPHQISQDPGNSRSNVKPVLNSHPSSILEATGWQRNQQGQVVLIAQTSNPSEGSFASDPASCIPSQEDV